MKQWEELKDQNHSSLQSKTEERLRSKILYKIVLILLKYIPIITALMAVLDNVLVQFEINGYILNYLGGTSVFTIIFMLVASHTFKYCVVHRIPIYYICVDTLVKTIDMYVHIPISDKQVFCLYMLIFGIFILIYSYYHVKNNKRSVSKISV